MSIAQSIRTAAQQWPGFLGDVERGIVLAFMTPAEHWQWTFIDRGSIEARTHYLLVAEALSEDIPREDLLLIARFLEAKTDEDASLDPGEPQRLAAVLRRLAGEGKSI